MTNLDKALSRWQIPDLPEEIREGARQPDIPSLTRLIHNYLSTDAPNLSRRQIAVAEWLYALVRRNIKRGRIFELDEVLATGHADCLGYVQLFATLGGKFGLKLRIVEVLVDNAGRHVPHYVNLLRPADGAYRFIDAWYGSTNINHRRIAALVEGKLRDINREELGMIKDIEGLPDYCIEALALYIRGNRYLESGEYDEAIALYSQAITLYPDNSRAYYNRAIAYEKKGETAKATADYAQALKDESSLIRVLASIHELEPLIKLDEAGISEEQQDIYLWRKGYKTGELTEYEEISRTYGIPLESVKEIVAEVERRCFN